MNSKSRRSGKSKDPSQVCILVLGMHRSGTSAVTRVLNLHGVSLGQDLLGPSVDNNIKGFWEKRAVVEVHERLLAEFHRSWHDPRPLPVGWLESEAAASAAQEISLILDEFSGQPIFSIKDPRICQFIDLWLPILRRRKIKPVAVLVVRHPSEVAESLRHRDGWPNELSWLLWSRSMIDATASTALLPRCVVSFTSLMSDWQDVMNKIAVSLSLRWPVSSEQATDAVVEFIDVDERHFHYDKSSAYRQIPRYLQDMYQTFLDLEAGASWDVLKELTQFQEIFDTSTVPLHEEVGPSLISRAISPTTSAVANEHEVEKLSNEPLQRARDHRIEKLSDQLLERDREIEKLAGQLLKRDQETEKLSDQLLKRGREIEKQSGQLQKRDRRIKKLSGQYLERGREIEKLTRQVDALVVDRDALSRLATKAKRERKELTQLLAGKEEQLVSLKAVLDRSNATSRKQKSMLADLNKQVSELVTARKEDAASAAHLQAGYRAQLAQRYAKITALKKEFQSTKAQLEASAKEMEAKYQAQLEAASHVQAQLETSAREMEAKYFESCQNNIGLNLTVEDIFQSLSWKIMAPVRKVGPITSELLFKLRRLLRLQSSPVPAASGGSDAASTNPPLVVGEVEPGRFSKKILLVSYYCPTRGHAGGLRILDIYSYLKEANPSLQLDLFTHSRPDIDGATDECRAIFDNVYLAPSNKMTVKGLAALGCTESRYDVIDLQFHEAGLAADNFRELGDRLVFTPMESALRVYLIGLRKLFRGLSDATIATYKRTLKNAWDEIKICRKVDEVVCVSRNDAAILRLASGRTRITSLETGLSMVEFGDVLHCKPREFDAEAECLRVLYVAYFGSQTNVDALKWYLDHVHLLVKKKVPGYVLTVVGRGNLAPFASYVDDAIEWVGEVPKIGRYIEQAAIGIAPALGGSGFRGKVNQYALFGVPCVVSPISLKGLAYQHKKDILVAKSASKFAKACVKLLLNPDVRNRIGKAAYERSMRQYTWKSKDGQLSDIYRVRRNMVKGERLVSVLVPSYNHGAYLKQRIESILGQTHKNIELIVIDDRSEDNSDNIIQELLKVADFRYIRNESNSGTPFSAWGKVADIANGDYVWICESDDFAEPSFLETAVRAMDADESAVIFYCNSWVVDEAGKRVGDTDEYFTGTWRESRWSRSFTVDGHSELVDYQQRGQVVPNMSSALIKSAAFQDSYSPLLKRFRLTGDWLFVGWLMDHGRVIFDPQHLSNFRKHPVTSRVRVQSARSQAEFVLTKFLLFKRTGRRIRELSSVLDNDAARFAHEPARWYEVAAAMLRVSWTETVKCWVALAVSVAMNPEFVRKLRQRLSHAKGLIK